MRILVAGAGGFIGGHLVGELCERRMGAIRAADAKPQDHWHQRFAGVENLTLDLRSAEACRTACAGVDAVFNLAADMGGMGFIESRKLACMLNVLINTHLLLAARDAGVGRYFFASSACVYNAAKQASPEGAALKEEDAYPAQPEDGYGWEKLFSERMCRHFREETGMSTAVARLHNVYGPMGAWRDGREKAPAAICRKVAEAVHEGRGFIEIWGDGRRTRSFTWIGDAVEGILRLMEIAPDEPVNLGSAERVTIDGLVDAIERVAGTRLERRYKRDAPLGVAGRNSDNTRIRAATGGFEPATPLAVGIERTYRWIEQEFLCARGAP